MAEFRGVVQGMRGTASRLGHRTSGLTVEAATWDTRVITCLSHDPGTGRNHFSVILEEIGSGRQHVVLDEHETAGVSVASVLAAAGDAD